VMIETGSTEGMIDLNRVLAELVRGGEISADSAFRYAVNPESLTKLI